MSSIFKNRIPTPSFFPPAESSVLTNLFTAYGFTALEQHLDLIRLLYFSGCLDPQQLQDDLGIAGFEEPEIRVIVDISNQAAKEQFVVKNLEAFDPALVLSKAFITHRDNTIHLEKIHDWFIRITQREFFARNAGEERWKQKTGQWMIDYKNEVRLIVDRLGLEKEIRPTEKKYDAIAVFGSTAPEMKTRLLYAKKLVDEEGITFKHLYLLCGERPADKTVDGGEEYLLTVAAEYKVTPDKVTETHLMKEAYTAVKGESKFAALLPLVVDAPKENKPRPTTVDTLIKLSEDIDNKVETIIFVSRAPNIKAQAEDTWMVLRDRFPQIKSSEIVGGSCEGVALNRIIGALGGAFFGGYPKVAMLLGSRKPLGQLKDKTKELSFVSLQALAETIKKYAPFPDTTVDLILAYADKAMQGPT